jgi:plasmid stabilization system protein ParE
MPVVRKRATAHRDLIEHFDHLEEHAGLATAERFLDQAEASFADLDRQRRMGAPLHLTTLTSSACASRGSRASTTT